MIHVFLGEILILHGVRLLMDNFVFFINFTWIQKTFQLFTYDLTINRNREVKLKGKIIRIPKL